MKISILKGPSTRDILGVFSNYEDARTVEGCLFPNKKPESCIVEYEVDEIKDLLDKGLLPWWVSVDVISEQTEIKGSAEAKLSPDEQVVYFQGKFAQIFVFAKDQESAEKRALDVWHSYNSENKVEALTIFEVIFDEHAEIKEIRRVRAVGPSDTKNTVNYPAGNIVSFRIVTNDIDEAIETAREMYDEWLDKQIVGEE